MQNTSSGSSKFPQVSATDDKQLDFIVNDEKHITDLLKDLRKSEVISETIYKKNSFKFAKELLTRTQEFSWLVWMLSPFLQTYH